MVKVIGAGPVGLFAAHCLANKGYNVSVFDRKSVIGRPVQCTGLLTDNINKILRLDEDVVVNRIKKARIFSPNKDVVEFNLNKPDIVVDRAMFDKQIASMAESSGVKIFLKHNLKAVKGNRIFVANKALNYEYLIGADGPKSTVSRLINLNPPHKLLIGNQVRVEHEHDENTMDIFLSNGCFSWIVPESRKVCRIGIVDYVDRSMHLLSTVKRLGCKVIQHQGGLIPLYTPKVVLKKANVLLIGDAAAQVKATTFGGIVPGMIAAKILSKSFEDYEKNAKKLLHKDLMLSLRIRKIFDKFSEDDYNTLVRLCSTNDAKNILENYERDFPSRFAVKLLFKQPRLLRFAFKALISSLPANL